MHEWPARGDGAVGAARARFRRGPRFRRGATSGSQRSAGRVAPRRPSAARRAWSAAGGSSGAASASNSTSESASLSGSPKMASVGVRAPRAGSARPRVFGHHRRRGGRRRRRDADGLGARLRREVVGCERRPGAARDVEGVEAAEGPPQVGREAAEDDQNFAAPDPDLSERRVRAERRPWARERPPAPAVFIQRPERVVDRRRAGRCYVRGGASTASQAGPSVLSPFP